MNTNEVKNYFKKSKYQEYGITLVALVVTIIVLLILAGVTISMATSGSGYLEEQRMQQMFIEHQLKMKMMH